jgi:hypothetical protein
MTETAVISRPANSIYFANSLALSGRTLAVGAPGTTVGFNQLQGVAFAYREPPGGWTNTSNYGAEFVSSDGVANDSFGSQVALGGGNVFVSAPNASINGIYEEGAIYVFGP